MTVQDLTSALIYTSISSILIPISSLLSRRRFFIGKANFVIAILLFISISSDAICYLLSCAKLPTVGVANTFFVLQFSCLSYFFFLILNQKSIIRIFSVVFLLILLICYFYGPIYEFKNLVHWLGSLILFLYAILFFRQLVILMPTKSILTYGYFWIAAGVLFYFFFLCFISIKVFKNMPAETSMLFWSFHNFNNIIKNLLFAIGVYYMDGKELSLQKNWNAE